MCAGAPLPVRYGSPTGAGSRVSEGREARAHAARPSGLCARERVAAGRKAGGRGGRGPLRAPPRVRPSGCHGCAEAARGGPARCTPRCTPGGPIQRRTRELIFQFAGCGPFGITVTNGEQLSDEDRGKYHGPRSGRVRSRCREEPTAATRRHSSTRSPIRSTNPTFSAPACLQVCAIFAPTLAPAPRAIV